MYSDRISFDLARKISDLRIATDQYYDRSGNIDIPGDYFDCDVPAPTYGEVFDWLKEERGIYVWLESMFTYAFMDRMAYTWKMAYVEYDEMMVITEEDVWDSSKGFGGSFGVTADAAIEYVLTLGDRRVKYIEVDVDEL